MQQILRIGLLGAVIATLLVVVAGPEGWAARPGAIPAAPPSARGVQTGLSGGAASMDELIARFVEGLRAKDRGALEALRVTEDEYKRVIVPGNVEKGQPPKQAREDELDYFWGVLNTKSVYYRDFFLQAYGGEPLRVKSYRFRRGVKEYAGFTAHQRLTLEFEDSGEDGEDEVLDTGSIAEVDGTFKFVSFIRD